ncbi:hypothetical protein HCAG_02405 [Histoplasma mississippiense (nom. inval.)]|uniref:hypothetical protein n=1 Tax=Ajellomyces capsulatus (strain NAm1 / WU24) TaxID=2059318 RepID=UPI000157BAE3|nr:hypothetical protein HCAG_02405 [Histoplasma mississippiense (nom. inval.)]EDN05802.1 hypothetical protein HCAG_02405 [Histoplasma mississippiense (nom. inval.)]
MAESVAKFSQEQIGPKVREMDEAETMDPAIVEQLFEQGLMGVEIPEEYGGAGMNFTSAIVGIEELAGVDPSVSVMCDVPNALGYKYAINLLNEGRIGIAAQMTGLALGAWENAAKYIWNDRRQFGQLIGEFQGMQHQVAQAYTEIAAARALVYNAARKKEAGQDFVQDAAMAKLYASQVAGRVAGSAVEWMGGMGFVREGIAEKMFRDSKIGAIYEGTSNIQLQTIAKMLQKQYTQ